MKTISGTEAAPYSDEELAIIKHEVEESIRVSRERGMQLHHAHPFLPRLIATIEQLKGK